MRRLKACRSMARLTAAMVDAGYELANEIGPEGWGERYWLERVYCLMRSMEPPADSIDDRLQPQPCAQSPASEPRGALQLLLPSREYFLGTLDDG
jgi:hypothetical protein